MFFARKIEKETCPSIHPSHILDLVKTSYDPEPKSTLNSYDAKRKKEKGKGKKKEKRKQLREEAKKGRRRKRERQIKKANI